MPCNFSLLPLGILGELGVALEQEIILPLKIIQLFLSGYLTKRAVFRNGSSRDKEGRLDCGRPQMALQDG